MLAGGLVVLLLTVVLAVVAFDRVQMQSAPIASGTAEPLKDRLPPDRRSPLPEQRLDGFGGSPPVDLATYRGKPLVVNFWATWCVPCRREIPAFVALQESYREQGLQFVGIALDTRGEVARFVDELALAVNYPLLIAAGDAGIALATDYGNRFGILPYTVLVDRAGTISFVQYGEISHAQADRAIRDLL